MKASRCFLLMMSCAVLLTSCTQAFVFNIFNNTGNDIVVISYDTKMNSKSYPIKAGSTGEIVFPGKLVVKYQTSKWVYQFESLRMDERYKYDYVRHGRRVQDIQIEPEGVIYTLPRNNGHVVNNFPQPSGFPLSPEKIDGKRDSFNN